MSPRARRPGGRGHRRRPAPAGPRALVQRPADRARPADQRRGRAHRGRGPGPPGRVRRDAGGPQLPEAAGSPGLRAGPAMLRGLRPTARTVRLGPGPLRRAALAGSDVTAARDRVDPAPALLPQTCDHDGVATLLRERRRPLHPARLYEALDQLVPAARRSRERFWPANRPELMLGREAAGANRAVEECGPWPASLPDAAAWELHPPSAVPPPWTRDGPYGDLVQQLTFTAEGLDVDGFVDLLDSRPDRPIADRTQHPRGSDTIHGEDRPAPRGPQAAPLCCARSSRTGERSAAAGSPGSPSSSSAPSPVRSRTLGRWPCCPIASGRRVAEPPARPSPRPVRQAQDVPATPATAGPSGRRLCPSGWCAPTSGSDHPVRTGRAARRDPQAR